jgi:uncharacterized membrane protein
MDSQDHQAKPFVAPCRDLNPGMPFDWLRAGWADYRKAPGVSVAWGLIVWVLSALVAWAAWTIGNWILLLTVLSGFIFIAPLLAFALYSVSRQLADGDNPVLGRSIKAMKIPFSNALVFALVLLIIFLIWARAASMIYIFFPAEGLPGIRDLLTFLFIGSAVGAIFAGFSFAASAFSLPFLANREVDIVTAVVSSINAVLRNKWTMFAWALLIVLLTVAGIVTALLGLIIVIPWLAYATWHGYRAALDVSEWPVLPPAVPDEEEQQPENTH